MAVLFQILAIVCLAPLVSGLIAKVKNNLRLRKGPGVLQPYYNLAKLFGKERVVPETASWIFRAAPCVQLASSLTALSLVVPAVFSRNAGGDFLALIFVLAAGRFFMALAALDAGSSFGGMGSSREMFVSSLAEPAACMAFFAVALQTRTTLIGQAGFHLSTAGACVSLFLVALAETSRIPVDNQETHLELTMIHEAMVLEYTGRSLALIELSAHIKQMVWFSLIGSLAFPTASAALFLAKIAGLSLLTAVIEISVAKMRLFRTADYFGFAFVTGLLASAGALFGV